MRERHDAAICRVFDFIFKVIPRRHELRLFFVIVKGDVEPLWREEVLIRRDPAVASAVAVREDPLAVFHGNADACLYGQQAGQTELLVAAQENFLPVSRWVVVLHDESTFDANAI